VNELNEEYTQPERKRR